MRVSQTRLGTIIPLLAAVLLLSSCAGRQSQNEGTATTTPPQSMDATAMTDAEIAAVVLAANDADIENGRQAQSMSHNADVKQFGAMMVADHGSLNDKSRSLASQLGLTPQENATSQSIRTQQESARAGLKSMSGDAFDRAYVQNEVAFHETVLNTLDQVLIPNAENQQLRQLLTDARPVIAQHLDHARDLQSKLGGATNP